LSRILEILFSPEEAELVAQLPVRSFNARRAAKVWRVSLSKARKTLDGLADKGLLVDVEHQGESVYTLPPPMAGFFEFSMMRIRSTPDQHELAKLFYQYLNVEEEFVRNLFEPFETQLGRVFIHEPAVDRQPGLEVLDFERVSHIVQEASAIAVGTCYCRHKMLHVGKACDQPLDMCITLNSAAKSLIKHQIARRISREECLDIFQQARDGGLVQFGENVREGVNFICNCCKCCCEGMIAARRFGWLHPVHTTAFLPEEIPGRCVECRRCERFCPVEAIRIRPSGQQVQPGEAAPHLTVDLDTCLGCGVCVGGCPSKALNLRPRPTRILTPVNSTHKAVLQAIEKGTLQHFIFDNQALDSHRALAAILGVILRLPPLKQILASRQFKSRFLEWLLKKYKFNPK